MSLDYICSSTIAETCISGGYPRPRLHTAVSDIMSIVQQSVSKAVITWHVVALPTKLRLLRLYAADFLTNITG